VVDGTPSAFLLALFASVLSGFIMMKADIISPEQLSSVSNKLKSLVRRDDELDDLKNEIDPDDW
ncbi:MAG: hypothetical protein SXQ77_11315, partial [Halobacteria archaeon]|nr:hypothetical protein [Halobacteria archaeon]